MQVSLESTGALGRRLSVQVPVENLVVKYRAKLSEAAKSVKIDGFRKGHVSQAVVEKRFGTGLRHEVITSTIEETLQKALSEHELRVAGQPNIDETNIEALITGKQLDQDLTYAASFEIYPTIDLTSVTEIHLTKKTATVTDQDVNTAIAQLQNQFGEWVPTERPAAQGDQVLISYNSLLDGQPYDEGKAEDITVELGTERFIAGFEAGLIGKSVGDTVVLDLSFPADWRLEKLAGKPVQFTINVKSVSEKKPAVLDEAFAKKVHAASDSREDIAAAIRSSLEKRISAITQTELREQIVDKLLAASPFELPQVLVNQEKHNLHAEMHQNNQDSANSCTHNHDDLQEKAERRVALGLLLSHVIHKENLRVDPKRVRARIKEMAENFGNNRYIEDMYLRSKELSQAIENAVLTEQVLDHLIAKAKLESSETTVKEILEW
ncbi:MAG: hypothetical protein RLZ35_925 [Pseudomonadota bacterium]|jgi:trigger factor